MGDFLEVTKKTGHRSSAYCEKVMCVCVGQCDELSVNHTQS